MFQGSKGYIAQECEVHLQYVWKQYNKMAVLHLFLVNSSLYIYSILYANIVPTPQYIILQVNVNRRYYNSYVLIYITRLRQSCHLFTAQLKFNGYVYVFIRLARIDIK